MVQHIHIHSTYILPGHHNITDSTCIQHVNFGLTQAHPNNWYGITSGLVSKAPLNPPPPPPDCPCALISCTNQCPEQVMRKDLESHLLKNCQLREHRCHTCNQNGPYQTMTTTHLDQCPDIIVPCPNECGVPDMPWKELKKHHAVCPAEEIQCGYPGCDTTLQEATKAARWTIPVGLPETLKDCISSHSAKPERPLGSIWFSSSPLHNNLLGVLVTWHCTSHALCCVSNQLVYWGVNSNW